MRVFLALVDDLIGENPLALHNKIVVDFEILFLGSSNLALHCAACGFHPMCLGVAIPVRSMIIRCKIGQERIARDLCGRRFSCPTSDIWLCRIFAS